MRRILLNILGVAVLSATPSVANAQFIDHSKAKRFIETDVHVLAGATAITQNYMSAFSEISEMNSSAGAGFGAGAGAVFGIREWLGLGTEINLLVSNNKLDMAVSNEDYASVSNIFISNRYAYADIPVYMSFRFNVLGGLRWNVDAGMYYRYGLWGKQKQTIYNSMVNDLGQLVPRIVQTKVDYFRDRDTFINSYNRSDIGLHIATGLQFGRHLTVSMHMQVGFKNIAYNSGLRNPNIHNLSFLAGVGYKL